MSFITLGDIFDNFGHIIPPPENIREPRKNTNERYLTSNH